MPRSGFATLYLFYAHFRVPLKTAFPDYTGKRNYEDSLQFVQARFKEQRKRGPVSYRATQREEVTMRKRQRDREMNRERVREREKWEK